MQYQVQKKKTDRKYLCMIEVVFHESAAGSLKLAQGCRRGKFRTSPKSVFVGSGKMANHEDCFARKRSGSGLPVKRQYHSEELLLIYLLFI